MSKPRRKRRVHWVAYLWPGLPHLWIGGSLAGLTLAIAFTVLLNVLILSVLVWPDWLASQVKLACAISAAAVWVAALVETRAELRRLSEQKENEASSLGDQGEETIGFPEERRTDALLTLAQRQYLRGEWNEAEQTLRTLLRLDKDDPEGNMLLASVHRRMGRTADALRRLRRLSTREDADRWRFEVQREVDLLKPTVEPAKCEETPHRAA